MRVGGMEESENIPGYAMHIPGEKAPSKGKLGQFHCFYCNKVGSAAGLMSEACEVREALYAQLNHIAKDPLNMNSMECRFCGITGDRDERENEACPDRQPQPATSGIKPSFDCTF